MKWPHMVTFEQKQRIDDGMGGGTDEWTPFITTQAHVQPLSGYKRIVAQQNETPVTTRVYYPYQEGITPKMRAIYREKVLTLTSDPIDQGGMGRVLMVECDG